MTVSKGNKVVIEYEGSLDDGTVFDASSKHGKPLEFVAGSGQVIPGFDAAVVGMKVGEEKKVHIYKKDAYGELNPDLKKEIPKNALQTDQEVKPGMVIAMQTPNGQQIPLKVMDVKDDAIVLDMNHPLAGQNLNFKIKLLEVK